MARCSALRRAIPLSTQSNRYFIAKRSLAVMNVYEPININEQSFERAVLKSPVPVLVDFWAGWCGPCKMIAPVLDEIAREQGGLVRIAKVDVDENPGLAERFGIRSIPTLLVFVDGELKETIIGPKKKADLLAKLAGHPSKSIEAR
jgi:thioredoxin 1